MKKKRQTCSKPNSMKTKMEMLATERKHKRAGLLGLRARVSVLNNDDSRKKSAHSRRGCCEVHEKRTNDFFFGCKTYLCLKTPPSVDQSDSENDEKHASFSNGGADGMLFENTCLMRHHRTGTERHLSKNLTQS